MTSVRIATTSGVTFSSKDVLANEYWFWMEQVLVEETTTKRELADMLDDMYDTEPCNPDRQPVTESPPEEVFVEKVDAHFTMDMCTLTDTGDWLGQLRLHRSHLDEPYTMRYTNGTTVRTTVVKEVVSGIIQVEKQSGVLLPYYVVGEETITWLSLPVSDRGSLGNIPIERNGNALNWGEVATGSISYSYLTQYDLIDFQVEGTFEGDVGECMAIGFYHMSYEDLSLTAPKPETDIEYLKSKYCGDLDIRWIIDEDPYETECYVNVVQQFKCECSGEVAYTKRFERVVECPENQKCSNGTRECRAFKGTLYELGGYVNCGEVEGNLDDPSYYEWLCCDPPRIPLPLCREKYRANPGRKALSAELMAEYAARYEKVRFVPVYPEDGNCGVTKETQSFEKINCCLEIPELFYDDENSADIMGPDSNVAIFWIDGVPPYTVHLEGEGFYTNVHRTQSYIVTNEETLRVYGEDACGVCSITVTDSCSQAVYAELLSTAGGWTINNEHYLAPPGQSVSEWAQEVWGLFPCSRFAHLNYYDESATRGRWSLSPTGESTIQIAYLHSSNIHYGLLGGVDTPPLIYWTIPSISGPQVPMYRSFADFTCAGAGQYEGVAVGYWYRATQISLYEYVCPEGA